MRSKSPAMHRMARGRKSVNCSIGKIVRLIGWNIRAVRRNVLLIDQTFDQSAGTYGYLVEWFG